MAQLPSGSRRYIATAFGASQTVSAVTNATEAVVTCTAHGYSNGDYVLMTSGWGGINLRAFRIKSVTTNTFVLEGADTTNTSIYPASGGTGSVVKATTFVEIAQVLEDTGSGGEPQNVEYRYMESDIRFTINDGFTANSRTLILDADSVSTPGYAACQTLSQTRTTTILRTVTKNGSFTLLPCEVALNPETTFSNGNILSNQLSLNGKNLSTRYAS
jgi:Mrp family chromosome partitioning ATPase